MAKVQVTLAGVEIFPLINDFSVEWRQNGRSTATFRLKDTLAAAPSMDPQPGNQVGIYYDGGLIWSGSVDSSTLAGPRTNIRHTLTCVSLEQLIDKRTTGYRSYHRGRFTADPSTDTLTIPAGHDFENDYRIVLVSDGTLPAPLQSGTQYWVINRTPTTLQLSQGQAGAPINITDAGTGIHHAWWLAGQIAKDMLADAGENITLDDIQMGNPVDKRIYKGEKLSDAIEELAVTSGYVWSAQDSRFQFGPRDYSPAPFSFIAPSTGAWQISKRTTREDFANVINLTIGWEAFAATEDTLATDGTTQEWELTYHADSIIAVLVNGEARRFGIEIVDNGLDFYWNPGEKRFVQEPTADPLTASDVLVVQYRRSGGNVITVEDADSITERATAESNSGRYELSLNAENIVTVESGQAQAQAILAGRNQHNRVLDVIVKTMMLPAITQARPSQLVDVGIPAMNIASEQYLVDTITARLFNGDDLEYRLRLLSSERYVDEIAYFRALAGGGGGGSFTASLGAVPNVNTGGGIAYDA